VYAIELADVDGDRDHDIILGGNLFAVKPEVGRYDALRGLVLVNDGQANFSPLSSLHSGINIDGEVRHISSVNTRGESAIVFIRNNDSAVFYKKMK
jgi:hypothetical protein